MPRLFPKTVKVFPQKQHKYISGVLLNQKKIEVPSLITAVSDKELRRLLSYATVYEVVDGVGDVLLTLDNYMKDNSDAVAATDVPEVELERPRDEEDVVEEEDDTVEVEKPVAKVVEPIKPVESKKVVEPVKTEEVEE